MTTRAAASHAAASRTAAAAALLLVNAACSQAPPTNPEPDLSELGHSLFNSGELSPSGLNSYSCATCHDLEASEDAPLLKPGAPLAGVTGRALFWGGQENDLLRAINACRNYFMVASDPLAADSEPARALYAYLSSLEPGDPHEQAFTVVRNIDPIPRGDAANGAGVYARACSYCHGSPHTGAGRLNERTSILPEDTLLEHADYSPRTLRLVFTEKVRHGLFLGYGGDMPPFSAEVLSNEDLADVMEYLGILGE
jgi:thiosulfate dehydrogenase